MSKDETMAGKSLTPAMRDALTGAERFYSEGYHYAGRWHGRGYMRRVTAAMSTLRALSRRGLVTRPEPLGPTYGDANAPGTATLTAAGLEELSR